MFVMNYYTSHFVVVPSSWFHSAIMALLSSLVYLLILDSSGLAYYNAALVEGSALRFSSSLALDLLLVGRFLSSLLERESSLLR